MYDQSFSKGQRGPVTKMYSWISFPLGSIVQWTIPLCLTLVFFFFFFEDISKTPTPISFVLLHDRKMRKIKQRYLQLLVIVNITRGEIILGRMN